jgi:hypothetical protein
VCNFTVLIVVPNDLVAGAEALDVLGSDILVRTAVQVVGQQLVVGDCFECAGQFDLVAADFADLAVCVCDFHFGSLSVCLA